MFDFHAAIGLFDTLYPDTRHSIKQDMTSGASKYFTDGCSKFHILGLQVHHALQPSRLLEYYMNVLIKEKWQKSSMCISV
eukprot:6212446-Pleurochrysis_carterae.AAC.1